MDDQEKEARRILKAKGWSKLEPHERAKVESWLACYSGPDEIIDSRELARRILESNQDERVMMTGMPGLDKHTEGFRDGELIVVGGKTKHGKTLFCQTLTEIFSAKDYWSLWFSYEMSNKEIIERFTGRISNGVFTEGKVDLPKFYTPAQMSERSVTWIGDKIAEGILKFGVRAVFIDHIHFLINLQSNNMAAEIGQIARELKHIARTFHVVIFIICHIKKVPSVGHQYSEDDLRDSALLSAEADATFMIYRDDDDEQEMAGDSNPFSTLVVCNHRYTGARKKKIRMMKQGKMLKEVCNEDQ